MSRRGTPIPSGHGFLCNVRMAAWALGVDCRTIRRMCERGEVKATKVGSDWRINVAELCAQYGIDLEKFGEAMVSA